MRPDPDPYLPYRRAWQRRWRAAERERQERTHLAVQAAEACARLLVERYGARRVYLFGSLATGRAGHACSDIDLAAEGLGRGRVYWRALAQLWARLPPGIELDLVPLEDADPELAERILKEGKRLHGDQGLR